ncbi:MAG: TIM-barrel domain-containing protein, partial [Bacillota bacterium]
NQIKALKVKGVRFLAYINPYLIEGGKMYNYCKEKGLLIKNKKGGVYHIKSTTFASGMMDLTNPEMVKYLKDTIIKENMLNLGIDGYMADFGEYLPVDCVLYDGDPKKMHNLWPVLWAKINREALDEANAKEAFFFTRSGYNGVQEYTPIMWNGDQHTDFSKDYGMPCVMPATFNLGFSGLTITHSDIGGYISFRSLYRDEELFIRWMEMNTFSPLMRTHETIRPSINCQYDTPKVLEHSVALSSLHKKLKPYIKECMQKANKGEMIIKPDFYLENDFNLHKDMYSYFFGDDIFVAPIIERGKSKRKVFLPKGEWVRFFTGDKYSSGEYELDCPLGKPLAFYRAESKIAELVKD